MPKTNPAAPRPAAGKASAKPPAAAVGKLRVAGSAIEPLGKAAPELAHEHVVLTAAFETHQGGSRIFGAGPRSLPPHLADEARAKGLVAPPEAE